MIYLIIIISLFFLSCSEEENPIIQEDEGISWDLISGKLAYVRQDILYIVDGDSGTVKSLGSTNLTNLKWNKPLGQITGIRYTDNSTYSLEGFELNGNRTIIKEGLSTKYYDWLPDGRLVTISKDGKVMIDDIALSIQPIVTFFGLGCSPDGKKIVVSTDNILENILLEIEINTLSQRIVKRSSNLLEPNFLQPVYSSESDKVFYVTVTHEFIGEGTYYSLWSDIKLESGKDPCRSDNPQKIFFTKLIGYRAGLDGIYLINIEYGELIEIINYAHSPVWIY